MAACAFFLVAPLQAGEAAHGYSPLHKLKYDSSFSHFGYVNIHAPRGGTLKLGTVGGFDSLNTLRYPGRTPNAQAERIDIRDLVYDTLLAKSADEPAGYYGLLARSVEVADDYSWARFVLRPDARWHDGKPVTADDVVFTFTVLARQGPPYLRHVLRGVTARAEDAGAVRFTAPHPGDREFVARMGLVAIHPRHFWESHDVTRSGMDIPLGSGPYRVASADPGRKIVFERVPDYWGANHPVNAGRHNFDHVEIEFFRDDTVALEAFRSGAFDLRVERDAVRWMTGYEGPALGEGRIRKVAIDEAAPGHLMSLVFNLRRDKFKDVRLRRAIALAYDFSWINDNLFHGQYVPVTSFFGNTRNAATGPAGAGERELLEPYLATLPDRILMSPAPPRPAAELSRREALADAAALLDEAGFKVKDGARLDPATGEPLAIRLAYLNPRLPRVLGAFAESLSRLGIRLTYPTLEPVSASKAILAHDFDMAALERWEPGLAPGTSESLLWSSMLADATPSYALAGAKDPVLDATIRAMTNARSLEELEVAARAFDRVLRWRQYAIPLWRNPATWVAYRNTVAFPDCTGLDLKSLVDLAWHKPEGSGRAGQ
ncbi:MAG: extracellular solute-binding protein [Hyphomicrobiales bacterium]